MPREGERRILLAHDMRVSLLNDAAIDIWFMRDDELNALHLRVKQGSSIDVSISHLYSIFLPPVPLPFAYFANLCCEYTFSKLLENEFSHVIMLLFI